MGKYALVFGTALLMAAPLAAQQPGGRGGRGGGGFGGGGGGLVNLIANNTQLQEELKIDKDQLTKLTEALNKVRDDLKDDLAKLRDFQNRPSQEERTAIQKKLNDANEKAVETVLKPEQVKRLHQIENQQAGVNVFAKEDVQKQLKLTDAQKDKLDEINKELQKDIRDLTGAAGAGGAGGRGGRGGAGGGFGGFNPENIQKMADLRKEAMTSAKKALTDEQKDVLAKEVLGAPFELQFQPGAGGFGGGRGGQPGKVLSTGAQDQLKLTDEQKKKVEDLQKQVDEQLNKILSEDQQKQLKDMQQQGGGRGGAGGGRGGRGGRGGNNPTKPNP
jgi:Spy/CpxP family protein refolding chaperone